MKIVFDNGEEQEIREEDFHKIILRALERADETRKAFMEAAERHTKQDDYKMALLCMKWADEESSIATICTTLETLYYDSQYSDK